MKIINYFLQAIFVYIFFLIGILLPKNLSRKFFSFLFEKIGPFFKSKRVIDRSKLSRTGYICIGWEHHLIRQKLIKGVPLDNKYIPVQQKQCIVPEDIK